MNLEVKLYSELIASLQKEEKQKYNLRRIREELELGAGRRALRRLDKLMHYEAGKLANKCAASIVTRKLSSGIDGL